MNGYELATQLSASGWCPRTMQLIAATGYAANEEVLTVAGFDGHMIKPINFQALEETLGAVAASPGLARRKAAGRQGQQSRSRVVGQFQTACADIGA